MAGYGLFNFILFSEGLKGPAPHFLGQAVGSQPALWTPKGDRKGRRERARARTNQNSSPTGTKHNGIHHANLGNRTDSKHNTTTTTHMVPHKDNHRTHNITHSPPLPLPPRIPTNNNTSHPAKDRANNNTNQDPTTRARRAKERANIRDSTARRKQLLRHLTPPEHWDCCNKFSTINPQ